MSNNPGSSNNANAATSSNFPSSSQHVPEGNPGMLFLPITSQQDLNLALPAYTYVLASSPEEGIHMKNLDRLQCDLEKCLSTCAVHNRCLRMAMGSSSKIEKNQSLLKNRHSSEKPKSPSVKNTSAMLNSGAIRKVSAPKKQKIAKFWSFTEPYCTNVTKKDINFLDGLIKESRQNTIRRKTARRTLQFDSFSIPPCLSSNRDVSKMALAGSIPKPLRGIDEGRRFSTGVLEQHGLLYTNLQENVPERNVEIEAKLKTSMQELQIISVDNEIEAELKTSMEELQIISANNESQLTQLRAVASKDLDRQKVKKELDEVDRELCDIYKKISAEKENHIPKPGDVACCARGTCSRKKLIEYEEQAMKLMLRQATLSKQLNDLINATLPV